MLLAWLLPRRALLDRFVQVQVSVQCQVCAQEVTFVRAVQLRQRNYRATRQRIVLLVVRSHQYVLPARFAPIPPCRRLSDVC